MRFSEYKSGTVFEISIDNPQRISIEDIKRYLELSSCVYPNKQEWFELISLRRKIAHIFNCMDADIEVKGNTLIVTLK